MLSLGAQVADMRRMYAVRDRRSRKLLALVRRAGHGSMGGTAAGRGTAVPASAHGQLDWQKVHERLGPVRPRWDLAILSNLNPEIGRRPKDVLAAVNIQSEAEHTLSPQVLSARLRHLEQGGYVKHMDSSAAPLRRDYFLLPRGTRLIDDLLAIVGPGSADQDAGTVAAPCR